MFAHLRVHFPGYDGCRFLPPVYKREPLDVLTGRIAEADSWCSAPTPGTTGSASELARRVKEANPDGAILFGGPQVPEDTTLLEAFLREYPFVDLACYGEGEIPFVEVLRRLPGKDWRDIPAVAWRRDGGTAMGPPAGRIEDLDRIPSPYLEGIFDPLIASRPGERWQALLETNRGCPFTCAFCAWGSASKRKVFAYSLDRVFREIDWISRNRIEKQARIDSGKDVIVGVNKYPLKDEPPVEAREVDNMKVRGAQTARLQHVKASRDAAAVAEALDALTRAAGQGGNLLELYRKVWRP